MLKKIAGSSCCEREDGRVQIADEVVAIIAGPETSIRSTCRGGRAVAWIPWPAELVVTNELGGRQAGHEGIWGVDQVD